MRDGESHSSSCLFGGLNSYCENSKQSMILQTREVTPKAHWVSGGRDFFDVDGSESL